MRRVAKTPSMATTTKDSKKLKADLSVVPIGKFAIMALWATFSLLRHWSNAKTA